ncbi:MAG: MFS transporter [Alphaproteobacteria bacterium]|nr:MFS transporter [Alphaproteobacteria bacterium]
MNNSSLTIFFSSIGHAFMHMFAAFYFVIILSLEQEWNFTYNELISLWTLGALLIGLGALPAGWLSDKWSRSFMMVIMFFGMGFSSILCGLSNEKFLLFLGLSLLGLSCSIYHPVGIAWVVNSSDKKGRALGINGIFGGIGIGSGAFIAGLLIKYFDWKVAFILPGIVSIFVGIILFIFIINKHISFQNIKSKNLHLSNLSNDLILIASIMLFSMFALGLTFQIMQTSIPKVFDIRIQNLSTFAIGAIIGAIYGIAGLMTLVGGIMADKFSLKKIYVIGIAAQVPCFFCIAYFTGLPLIIFCFFSAMFNSSILPTENILLAKLTPEKHHGLIYGFKFIIAFGSAPIAVFLISKIYEETQEFTNLFYISCTLMIFVTLAVVFLPINNKKLNFPN